jgi:hypothetical protein
MHACRFFEGFALKVNDLGIVFFAAHFSPFWVQESGV